MTNISVPLVKVLMPPPAKLMPALEEVLYSGFISEGAKVYEFEERFAEQMGLPNSLGMSSGTGALHVAMLLAGVTSGSEVISTSMTAEPTNTTILSIGAKVIFADVNAQTGNLDPDSVAAAITSRTSAICVVHYAGYPADMARLRQVADQAGLPLIEDCAHALGSSVDGRPIGTIGDYGIFSFQAIKHMTTVDGGVLTMRDPNQLDLARRLRWFGMSKGVARTEVDIVRVGYKYNMNNVSATIGLAQLPDIQSHLAVCIDNGRYYDSAFSTVTGVEPAKVQPNANPSYWLYTLLADDSNQVEAALSQIGVAASKLHRPNHLHSAFNQKGAYLPGLEAFYRRLVHIPSGWWVNNEARNRIVDRLRAG